MNEAKKVEEQITGYEVVDGGIKMHDNNEWGIKAGIYTCIRVKSYDCEDKKGKKFKSYKAICNNKRYMDLSFTMDCGNPIVEGNFILLNAITRTDTNRLYPRVYVFDYEAIIPYDPRVGDTLEYKRSAM